MKRYLIQEQMHDGQWLDRGYEHGLEDALRILDARSDTELRVVELTPLAYTRMERSPVRELVGAY